MVETDGTRIPEPTDSIGSLALARGSLPSEVNARSALAWAMSHLSAVGVDTPRLDAELLLCQALGWSRTRLYAHPEQVLSEDERTRFRRLVRWRVQREPLAYLLGHKEFFGLDFVVDPRVLIPRPETELLVERAIAWLQDALSTNPAPSVADVGTGCGAVAISVATHLPSARVYALDISAGALEVARTNCQRHGVEDRVELLQGDPLAPLGRRLDLILANLPYVASEEYVTLQPEIVDYEPRAALDGGPGGLEVIRRLLEQAGDHLALGAAMMLEIGAQQGLQSRALALRSFPTAHVEVHRDHAGRDRILEVDPAPACGG